MGRYAPHLADLPAALLPRGDRARPRGPARQYSSFEEDALAARQLAARRNLRRPAITPSRPDAAQQRDPDQTLFTKGFDKLGPDNADSVPLPLLILAGLSLLLVAAGGAGLVSRRLRTRRVPGGLRVRPETFLISLDPHADGPSADVALDNYAYREVVMASAKQAQSAEISADEVANQVVDGANSVAVKRLFTIPGRDPFEEVEWEVRDALIPGKDKPVFEQKGVEFPKFWSQTATNIVAQKYFRGRMGSPDRESSVKQMIGRIVSTRSARGAARAATSPTRTTRRPSRPS